MKQIRRHGAPVLRRLADQLEVAGMGPDPSVVLLLAMTWLRLDNEDAVRGLFEPLRGSVAESADLNLLSKRVAELLEGQHENVPGLEHAVSILAEGTKNSRQAGRETAELWSELLDVSAQLALTPEDQRPLIVDELIRTFLGNRQSDVLTPRGTNALLAALVAHPGQVMVVDPACGYGGTLAAAFAADRDGPAPQHAIGLDIDQACTAITQLRLLVTARGTQAVDVHRRDAHPHELELLAEPDPVPNQVDAIVCVPPTLAPHARHKHDLAPTLRRWLEYTHDRLAPHGRAVVLVPAGVANNQVWEGERRWMIERGMLDAVIALPRGSAGTGSPPQVALLVVGAKLQRDDVLFVDGERIAGIDRNRPGFRDPLPPAAVEQIARIVRDRDPQGGPEGAASIRPNRDLLATEHAYLQPLAPERDLKKLETELFKHEQSADAAAAAFNDAIRRTARGS